MMSKVSCSGFSRLSQSGMASCAASIYLHLLLGSSWELVEELHEAWPSLSGRVVFSPFLFLALHGTAGMCIGTAGLCIDHFSVFVAGDCPW